MTSERGGTWQGEGHDRQTSQRLRSSSRQLAGVGYDIKFREISSNDEWEKLVMDNPWSPGTWRRKTAEFLQAKMEHDDPGVQFEGVHGLWELGTNQAHHADLIQSRVIGLVDSLKSPDWRIVRAAAAAIWALSPTAAHRRTFGEANSVQTLLGILKDLLKTKVVPESDLDEDYGKRKGNQISETDRDSVQEMVTGALAMLLIDRSCRVPLITLEPDLATFMRMCSVLEGYSNEKTAERRINIARILCSMIQRDSEVRHSLISNGQLRTMVNLMADTQAPGYLQMGFCMASALATLVLDDHVMRIVRERGEAPMMFESCLDLANNTLQILESGSEEMPQEHAVKLTEAAGQAMWGAAYECVQPGGGGVQKPQILLLSKMVFQILRLKHLPLARVLHCIAATLATLSSNEEAANVIMESDTEDVAEGPVIAMLEMVLVEDEYELQGCGHVRAAATTSLAFLAGHPVDAEGDACMSGPHRPRLLEHGTMDKLLEAALTQDLDPALFKIIQHSAAVGVMYLSTMAGTVSPKALAMLAALMQNSSNVEMVEYLMAAFWILLRDSGNRRLLSEAFAGNPFEDPRRTTGAKLKRQLQDVSNTNAVSDEVEAAQRHLEQQFASLHVEEAEQSQDSAGGTQPGDDELDAASAAAQPEAAQDAVNPANKKDWGLDILVSVGETWKLLKLFEFLVASLCLFLIDEDSPVPPRRVDVFEMGVPRGGPKRKTWWSVAVFPPDAEPREPPAVEKSLQILCRLLNLKMYIGWKVVQLSVVSLWNCAVRSASTEKYIVQSGVVERLISIASTGYWPPTLREAAAGHVMQLAEEWSNISHMGGTKRIQEVMVQLIKTKHPLLEMRAARYIGRLTFTTPYLQPKPRATLAATKENIAAMDGIVHLVKLLTRCQKRYNISLRNPNIDFRPKRLSDTDMDRSMHFEKDCNTVGAILECYYYTLCSLLNLSTLKANQVTIARKGLRILMGIISYFSRQHVTTEAEGNIEKRLYLLASSVVQNLSLHPKNRTIFYKAELTGSAALERELEGGEDISALPNLLPREQLSARKNRPLSSKVLEPLHSIRPKVVFSTVSPGPSLMPSAGSQGQGLGATRDLANTNEPEKDAETVSKAPEGLPNTFSFQQGERSEENTGYQWKSKEKFLRWFETSEEFSSLGKTGSEVLLPHYAQPKGQDGRRRFDDQGNWIVENRDLKGLPRLLRRPLNHLWEEPPDYCKRNGAMRWEPGISEFRQPKDNIQMSGTALRLMSTRLPNSADNLLKAAIEITKGGSIEIVEDRFTVTRPTTAEREGGRLALTRLYPDEDTLQTQEGSIKWDKKDSVPLTVVLAPNRERTVISFENRVSFENDAARARLAVFEAIDGSKVYNGLFPAYQLPNGKRAHFYFQGGALVDEQEVNLQQPPKRPSSIPAALQRKFPMTEVLDKISRPPGSSPPFIPYKPVPRLAPLPDKHSLNVTSPDLKSAKAFGNLRLDNIQLIVSSERITTTEVETTEEDVYVPPPEEKEPWDLMKSIFKARLKEADSKDFWDTEAVTTKMFERDWQHAISKDKFATFLARENKSNTNNNKPSDEECIAQVHQVMKKFYKPFYSCFLYYASIGSGSPLHMQLNSWTMFLDSANIPDTESPYIKRSDCDTLFIVSNYVADKKAPENKVNDEHALMRFEFLEALVRAGISKYGKGVSTVDVAEAVTLLFEKNILPSLTPYSSLWPNDFREVRLYTEECDDLFKKNSVILKAIYSRYRLRPSGGGLRPKVLKLDGWLKLIDDSSLCDSQFTLQDATQCYLWSRMAVIDELKDFVKYESMLFIDFLEAIGRVADMKFIPAASDLQNSGYENVLQWSLAKEQLGEAEIVEEGSIFKPRPSCELANTKTRPLYAKVELLLDLMFRRLYYDPSQPDLPYSKEALLKYIRKIDKDMGS
eukprot:CAMPEP_0177627972 /NCGR_PEP_ID=MMETSP0419_2-20121207/31498_1 /TAXON_ID=582737 /ORGANISM="Tetraselmis sp., Strain GSL018" /LENGTH=1910 /DNA_ID=CAMNT_0019129181 /DNA_START=17 /DNA_END=5750 /DNA_ORIENTATION=+